MVDTKHRAIIKNNCMGGFENIEEVDVIFNLNFEPSINSW